MSVSTELIVVGRYRSIRLLQAALLFILVVAAAWAYSVKYTPVANASGVITVTPSLGSATGVATLAPSPSSTPIANSLPACSPDNSYQPPVGLPLDKPGLQQVIDSPASYMVYGNTPTEVVSQINKCTPVHITSGQPGLFAATTGYAVNWQFDYAPDSSGSCVISDVRVGLHVSQVFPAWQSSNSAVVGLDTSWQNYITKLKAYEKGHVQLDETEAATILSDLENFPPTDCGSIDATATGKAQADLSAYDTANADYDTANNYGLKQNIVL